MGLLFDVGDWMFGTPPSKHWQVSWLRLAFLSPAAPPTRNLLGGRVLGNMCSAGCGTVGIRPSWSRLPLASPRNADCRQPLNSSL